MVDTSRTVSDLTTNLFQDSQAAGSITPQDLRDLIETCQVKQGSMYVSSAAETTISVAGTFVEGTAGTWTLSTTPTANEFDENTDGRLRYTGTPTINCFFSASASISSAVTSKKVGIALHKNGTLITGTKIFGYTPTTTSASVNLVTFGFGAMATNDYISVFVTNSDSTDNVTLNYAQVMGMGLVT